MNLLRPTAQEERWLAVGDRHPALHDAAEARAGGWKTASLLSRVLMFALGLLAASLIAGSLLWVPARFITAGLVMIVAGEWLIRQRRLFAGGIEEALIVCGVLAIVAESMDALGGSSTSLWAFGLSVAVLAAGLRLGNALFTTLAALGLSIAATSMDDHEVAGMLFCVSVAIGALVLGARAWERPSHDRMLDGLVIAMPAAAQGWAIAAWSTPLRLATLSSNPSALVAPLLALCFAIALIVIGVRRRSHAPLIGALIQLAFLAWALRELTGLPLQARMIGWGLVLLAIGLALDRGLRKPRGGITSARAEARSRIDDLAQIYGAAHVAPTDVAPASSGVEGQGGNFGGGGASGRF
ncbi:MAG: hypothetical protein ABW136_01905 [Steroidobacteraceae bacterium]